MNSRKSIASACVLLVLYGCDTFPRNTAGDGFGHVHVGSPRVEGRERLINERREQERWLRDQLDRLDEAKFDVSGAVDLRSSSSFGAQLGVDADPVRKLNSLNLGRTVNAAQRSSDDESAVAAFRTAQRDKIFADVQSGALSIEDAQKKLTALGIALNPSAASSVPIPTSGASAAFGLKAPSSAASASAPSGDPRRSGIVSTPIEEFSDRLAAREVIRNELNDIRLDDLHDLSGNSLIRLTFDSTVVPESDASAWAVIRMKVSLPLPSEEEAKRLLALAKDQYVLSNREFAENTFRSILNKLNDECFSQELTSLAGQLGARQQEVFYRAFACATAKVGSNTRRTLERHATDVELLSVENAIIAGLGGKAQDQRTIRSRLRTQSLLLNRRTARESDAEFAYRAATLNKWALWTGQVLDAFAAAEFANSALSCFFTLKEAEASAEDLRSDDRGRLEGPSGFKVYKSNSQPQVPEAAASSAAASASSPSVASAKRFVPPSRCPYGDKTEVQRFREMLKDNVSASVYAVTPKESVQRISEVASNRKAVELAAGLTGTTGAVGLQAALSNMMLNESMAQSLKRQPLTVGFTENGRISAARETALERPQSLQHGNELPLQPKEELSFGWILGPAFQMSNDGKSTRFRHIVSQRSLAAELSVPAWMEKIQVEYETYWIREDGTVVRKSSDVVTETTWPPKSRTHGRLNRFSVSLASYPVSALAAIDDQYLRVPKVDDFQYLDLEEGKPAAVMITGRNVWRSTEVYIGGQPARQLTVLPDNKGVVAMWSEVQRPLGSVRLTEDGAVALSLVTSEGRVQAGRAHVRSKQEAAPAPLSATGMASRFVAGEEYVATLSRAAADKDIVTVKVRTSDDESVDLDLAPTVQVSVDRKTIRFTAAAASLPKFQSGKSVSLFVSVKHANGAAEVLPLMLNGVYYASAAESLASVTAAKAAGQKPVVLSFTLPVNAMVGFRSLKEGRLKFEAKFNGKPLEGTCQIQGRKCVGELVGESAVMAQLHATKNTDIKLSVKLVGDDVPGVTPQEVVVP